MKRFVTTFFSELFCCGICLSEVARTGAASLLLSDCNKAKENDHPHPFPSMLFAAKSYSSVKYSEKANISFFVFLSPNSLPLTSHRHISLLAGKRYDLSGQWRMRRGSIAEAIQIKVLLPMLVLIRTCFRTSPVVKVLNQEFGFNIFLLLRLSYLLCRPIE